MLSQASNNIQSTVADLLGGGGADPEPRVLDIRGWGQTPSSYFKKHENNNIIFAPTSQYIKH